MQAGLSKEKLSHAKNFRAGGKAAMLSAMPGKMSPPLARLRGRRVPLWLKIAYTLFLAVLVPVYWIKYGPANFLWFCDIALLATAYTLWLEASLPASMVALGLLPEIYWNADFFGRLLFGLHLGGLSDYMFLQNYSLFLRGLSLFHVFLPVLLLWLLWRLGYHRWALLGQTALSWIVLPCCYLFTDPKAHINWVFAPKNSSLEAVPPLLYFWMIMLVFPVVAFLPMHGLYCLLFSKPPRRYENTP